MFFFARGSAYSVQAVDGTAANPSISFNSDYRDGFYHTAAGINVSLVGVIRSQFAADGIRTNLIYPLSSPGSLTFKGLVTDGASAIGIKLGNNASLTTAGAKITSFYSDTFTTEKAYVTKDGVFGGSTLIANAAGTVAILNDSADVLENNAGWIEIQTVNGNRYRMPVWNI